MSHKNIFIFTLTLFIVWKILLTVITDIGLTSFSNILRPENILTTPTTNNTYWETWANWDGAHFLSIAQKGYDFYEVVFFPLYPLLIKILSGFNLSFLWSGLFISNFSFLSSLYFFYKLILLDEKKDVAQKAIFLLIIFPTSFYFTAVYSESLFFLFTVSSFYYARRNNFFLAFLLAGLSSITRSVGIFTVLSIIAEFLYQNRNQIILKKILLSRQFRFIFYLVIANLVFFLISNYSRINLYIFYFLSIFTVLFTFAYFTYLYFINPLFNNVLKKGGIWCILAFIPLTLYCLYLFNTQASAFAFVQYQANWGRQISLPWQTIINNINFSGSSHYSYIELIFTLIFILGFIYAALKLRISYTLYFGLSLLLPLLTGTLLSIPRFGLLFFPLFILLAKVKSNIFFYVWIIFSTLLLALFSIMFINNYWVA